MSHYQPYPAYKDSGVEWLGRVPENWDIRAVKTLARLDGGSGFPEDEQGQSEHSIPFFKVAELVSNLQTTDNTAVSRNKCNSQLIFLSMLITKLGIPASETSLPLGV